MSVAAVSRAAPPALPFWTPTPAWDHQREAWWFAHQRTATLLHMGMGTGKTRVAFDLMRGWGSGNVVVACPKAVIPAWARQAELHYPEAIVVTLDDGTIEDRANRARRACATRHTAPVVVVGNYEAWWRPPLADWLMAAPINLMVADEIHRLKSPGSRVSKFFGLFGRRIGMRRLGLSGTPLAQGPLDAYAEFRFLDPGIFGTSYTRFRSRYAVMGGFERRQVIGYINEPEFRRKFQSITYHADRSVIDLPGEHHIERSFTLPPAALRVYRDLRDEFVAQVESGVVTAANALPRLLRLQQVTSGFLPVGDQVERLHDAKAQQLADVLEDLDPSEPVVVFARFREDLSAIHAVASRAGRTSSELSGSRRELAEWQAGRSNVLVVQIQSGSEGIDLTRAAYAVFWSVGFSLAQYEQALARTSRPGQTRRCIFIHLIAEHTVDRKVYRVLRDRRDVIDAILSDREAA
jgi:SNF2 family DNA or RNA helicase